MNRRGVRVLSIFFLLMANTTRADLLTVPLPATLNQQSIGEINARVNNNEIASLDISPIRAKLEQILPPEQYAKLPDNHTGWVIPSQLEAAGVHVKFDFQNLILLLNIPPNQRRTETVSLVGTPDLRANRIIEPDNFSAYMNVRGGIDYTEASRATPRGFDDPQISLENAFNLRRLVLENETSINPAPGKSWEKRDSRLIWDMPESRLRWTLGDLNYPVTSFQGFLPMAGFSLHRADSLQPYRVTSPLGQSSFYLKSDSRVEVLVNGHTIQTLQMNAGPHQINNFPLTGGANNVVLRITDPVGRVEYINAAFFYDPGLLKQGDSEFNYAVGFPSMTDAQSPFYQYKTQPAVSAYHRWGLTDTLTMGVNAQAMRSGQQAGAEAVLSTIAGVLDLDLAYTHDREIGSGHAEQLQYRYYAPPQSVFTDGILSLAVRHADANYSPPNPFATAVSAGETWDFQASCSQRFGEHLNAGLGFSQQIRRSETAMRTYSMLLSHHWGRVNTSVTIQRNEDPATGGAWSGFFSVIIDLDHGFTAFSSHDTTTHSTRAELQYSPQNPVEAFYGTLGVEDSRGQQDIYGNVRYYGRRAEITLSQDTQTTGEDRASLRWGTAIVYADGQFGISRPVQDSFVIVDSTGNLRDQGGLGLQPQDGRYAAQEDWLGPAVMPELTAYYNIPVTIEPRRPEADFDPQEGDILLKPTYRSGTHVRIGQPSSANITATLVWSNGKPADLQSGTLTAEDGTTTEFITNRKGLIYLHGLPKGSYRGEMSNRPETSFTIIVPTNKNENVDLGTVRLPITE